MMRSKAPTSRRALLVLVSLCVLSTVLPSAAARGTTRVSVGSFQNEATGSSGSPLFAPAVSGDGSWVAFDSAAPNLVPNDTNTCSGYSGAGTCPDIFVRQMQTGLVARASIDWLGTQANGESSHASISADGRHIVFQSLASNLVPRDVDDGRSDVYAHDMITGMTTKLSSPVGGLPPKIAAGLTPAQTAANGASDQPAISGDGRFVVFRSSATNLVPLGTDTNGSADIFLRDRDADGNGVFDEDGGITTRRISASSGSIQADGPSAHPAISSDASTVAFDSSASNLVPSDTNVCFGYVSTGTCPDVFVREIGTGTTRRASVLPDGTQASGKSQFPSLSSDGRMIAFESDADGISAYDSNHAFDVFVRDAANATTIPISVPYAGATGPGFSVFASISRDGRLVVFASSAANLAGDGSDTNTCATYGYTEWGSCPDIFLRDIAASATTRISLGAAATQGNAPSFAPQIAADGKTIVYTSAASNLVGADLNGANDVFASAVGLIDTGGLP